MDATVWKSLLVVMCGVKSLQHMVNVTTEGGTDNETVVKRKTSS